MEEFEAYLKSKKIDAKAFRKHERQMWEAWKQLFAEVHPNSFTQQKLFLINPVRRKYPLKEELSAEKPKPAKVKPKFKIPPRPKK